MDVAFRCFLPQNHIGWLPMWIGRSSQKDRCDELRRNFFVPSVCLAPLDDGHLEELVMEIASQHGLAPGQTIPTQSNATHRGAAVRGPLRYEVETSSPLVEAGRSFTVFLRITNPYEVPVEITHVEFLLPIEFSNETMAEGDTGLNWRNQFNLPRRSAGKNKRPTGYMPFERQIAVAVTGRSRTGGLGGSPGLKAAEPEEVVSLADSGEILSAPEIPVTIQPGNTMVHMVSLRTDRWLWFSPAVYQLEALINYHLDGLDNSDSAKVSLNVKAPVLALISGAIVGALAGSLVGLMKSDNKSGLNWAQALVNVVLSVIVIVAFARKKDAQPFVSIEDFYGGLFVGFTVSLAGEDWLNWLQSSGKPPSIKPG